MRTITWASLLILLGFLASSLVVATSLDPQNEIANTVGDQATLQDDGYPSNMVFEQERVEIELPEPYYMDTDAPQAEGNLGSANPSDTKGQRVTRLIIYYVAYGLLLDLGIYFARYMRSNESHDEFHAAVMFLAFSGGLGMDIWFAVLEWKRLTTDGNKFIAYLGLMIYVNLIAIPQISKLVA